MKSCRMLIIFLLISIITCAGGTYAIQPAINNVSFSESALQKDNKAQQNTVTDEVIDEVPLPSDAEELARRLAKNRLHNQGGADLTAMAPDTQIAVIGCGENQPLLPTEYTPIILIGTVVTLQPYLSEDKSTVYTEYSIQVEKYLKQDMRALPMVGDRLIVDRPGGVLRLRDGHVIQYYVSGTNMARPLHVGERFVLFLNRTYDSAVLTPGPGFLLQNGKAYAVGQREKHKELFGKIPGVDKSLSQETEFIKAVVRAIENPPLPAFYSALEVNRNATSNQ